MEKKTGKVYTKNLMTCIEDINSALDKMILSASGWRGIFATSDLQDDCGNEESAIPQIDEAHFIISAAAAMVFAEYLMVSNVAIRNPMVLIGCDTRPTGKAIIDAMIPVLLACGCDVHYAGVTAAPEIMAWARSKSASSAGFIYISASHNPIGHNGVKFGLTDGGVLPAEEMVKLISNFRLFMGRDDCIAKIKSLVLAADSQRLQNVYSFSASAKAEAFTAYYDFCGDVAWGGNLSVAAALKDNLVKRPLGIVCDFNGSARTVSIDRDFFSALGLKFESINSEPGQIVHRIVPEGESLEPCCSLLEEVHGRDASFLIGYVPDCDGDRGNLVILGTPKKHDRAVWTSNTARHSPDNSLDSSEDEFTLTNSPDYSLGKARILEAQEVFALACIAELSHLVWTGGLAYDSSGNALLKAAIAVNDPTSMRIDRIAEAFGVSVFRAEVGEANVVGLASRLREKGYTVRILGEGSAGGNITHPSAVRDPVNTVLALVKLLSLRSAVGKPGLFEIWCKLSGQTEIYRDDFSPADIAVSLPPFVSTPSYSQTAVLRINTKDHGLLKDRYQKIFMREWEERKDELKLRFGFHNWEAIAYNGLEEKRGLTRFGDAGKGGLKICFLNEKGRATAYIWMRGSATEPVFRIMADVEGSQKLIEQDLVDWQRRMITEAD
ncbi:MAG: phosphatidylglycerol lysyltransferase [Treponema sp.]|nr:phosphatidylglycerol lysyltransferase [Treponema sp.]